MKIPRILVVQDLSCLGQCSLTVALPVISALGVEACPLPTTLLSTHSVGFEGFFKTGLTKQCGSVIRHFKRLDIHFDGIYAGYLGGMRQLELLFDALALSDGKFILDPAMADGELYPGLDAEYVDAMRALAGRADVVLPNLSEARLLTGIEQENAPIERLFDGLFALGAKAAVITGVRDGGGNIGVAVGDGKGIDIYTRREYARVCHGAGDVFASAFTGLYVRGADIRTSARLALDFTHSAIENTLDDNAHWYGLHFEPSLAELAAQADKLLKKGN